MSLICGLTGHQIGRTLIISAVDDFYDIDEVPYCRRCGALKPRIHEIHRILNALF